MRWYPVLEGYEARGQPKPMHQRCTVALATWQERQSATAATAAPVLAWWEPFMASTTASERRWKASASACLRWMGVEEGVAKV